MLREAVRIFVVDDDEIYAAKLAYYLSLNPEFEVKKFYSAKSLNASLHEKPDIITLDYFMPDIKGDSLLTQIKDVSPETEVIIISGQEDIQVAIDLFKKGVHDYIVKDAGTEQRLWMAIQNLKQNFALKKEVENLKQQVERKYNFQNAIIGNSSAIKKVFGLMEKAAATNITVSITGETGTGKELVAKAIHFNSERKKYPFVPVNVAAIPKDLLESELFGHEKGSFTGAANRRIGKFEEAHNGTLFLDEIGEMDINLQAKLLRALQEKEITRIGSNEIVKTNVRIIVATHRNLKEEITRGNFREDLYYRLLGLPIVLPPLRERDNDILLIAKYFIDQFCKENGLGKKHLSLDAKQKLLTYTFPGNIREIKSIIELACVMADGEQIEENDLQIHFTPLKVNHTKNGNYTLKEYTIKLIQQYLDEYDYDVLKVAGKLDVGKSTIYRMINNYGLKTEKRKTNA
ncbi:sigma-54-dependent transcriptional regulator [Parafilimonas sp.]|uniref:sigma-54-dependent transcriptional regulator n=1 Tax=Parafilimonas sp. TaxID=1969739 RepID=UPI003F81D231